MTNETITRAVTGFQDIADRHGVTTTITGGGRSTTFGPRNPGRETGSGVSAPRPMTLVDGGWDEDDGPLDHYPVPDPEDAFDDAESGGFRNEFIEADGLEQIADALIAAHPALLGHLAPFRIAFRWKRSGGGTTKATLGECKRLSGLARHAIQAHFLVWLAADHLTGLYPTNWHIEALLFHELLHASFDPKTAKPMIRDHDFAGFHAELRVYGPWHEDLLRTGESFLQVPMWDDDRWSSLGRFVPLMGAAA